MTTTKSLPGYHKLAAEIGQPSLPVRQPVRCTVCGMGGSFRARLDQHNAVYTCAIGHYFEAPHPEPLIRAGGR